MTAIAATTSIAAALAAIALVIATTRRAGARRAEAEYGARRRLGADGIVPGAEGFALQPTGAPLGGSVLLLHGFGDTPQALRGLAAHLAERGFHVRAPLLPGHGRTLRDFASTGLDDWLAAARAELAALRRDGPVALCGLSMGGALSAILAAEHPDVPALVMLAPYVALPDAVRHAARAHRMVGLFTAWFASRGEQSIHDPVERDRAIGYGYATPRHLHELARVVAAVQAALPRVVAPTLVVQSRLDNRIAAQAADAAFARLGAREKRFVWTDEGGHVITVDTGRERVWQLAGDWLAAHAAPQVAHADGGAARPAERRTVG